MAGWLARLLAAGFRAADREEMEAQRISAGIPAIPADLGPADLPNEGGLEETALSFTKGCYLGQEVMARLRNLGQVRRRLQPVRGPGPAPRPSTALFQGDRRVGEIRTAAAMGDGFVALAMISLPALQPDGSFSVQPGGPPTIRLNGHE